MGVINLYGVAFAWIGRTEGSSVIAEQGVQVPETIVVLPVLAQSQNLHAGSTKWYSLGFEPLLAGCACSSSIE